MDCKRKVPVAVVRRLPRYYRYLSDLLKAGITRISSHELSLKMRVTASQIRQDFNCFGGFGQQGYGYNVEFLYNELKKILGVDEKRYMIIIGAGNIGRALARYDNFEKRGFVVSGIFDVNPDIVGTELRDIKVQHMDNLKDFLKNNKIDIAALCVPYNNTHSVALKVVELGIKAIWNFSAMELDLPQDVIVENVHLSDNLMILLYKYLESSKE